MAEENVTISILRRHEEDILLASLLLISILFFWQSLSLSELSRVFPIMFSAILMITTTSLLASKHIFDRSSDLDLLDTTSASEEQEPDLYPLVLVALMIVFIVVSRFINITSATFVFVSLYSITRKLAWWRTALLLLITVAINYVFIEIINSPIL